MASRKPKAKAKAKVPKAPKPKTKAPKPKTKAPKQAPKPKTKAKTKAPKPKTKAKAPKPKTKTKAPKPKRYRPGDPIDFSVPRDYPQERKEEIKSAMIKVGEALEWDNTNRVYRNRDGSVDGELRIRVPEDADLPDFLRYTLRETLQEHGPLTADGWWTYGQLLLSPADMTSEDRVRYATLHEAPIISTHGMQRQGNTRIANILGDVVIDRVIRNGRTVKEVIVRWYWHPENKRRERPEPR